MIEKKRIVVIGGGFGGLNLIKKLDKKKFDVLLIDRNNFHSFPPLFYQIASSALDPGSISFPFRRELRKDKTKGTRYNLGEVQTINFADKVVTTQYDSINYDILVIAAGTTNNFFGIEGLKEQVYTLKSAGEALRCRNEILYRLEQASLAKTAEERRKILSFTIIGGGPTGVEIAGAIGEMKRYVLSREYPDINVEDLNVTIIEGTDRLLRTMTPRSSDEAKEYLGHLMVDVKLEKTMSSYRDNIITFADGEELYSEMVIWTAGITGEPFSFEGGQPEIARGNRLVVDKFNKVAGVEDVYAIGDISSHCDERFPGGYPQLAQVAIQQAKTLAKNLNKGKMEKTFNYNDKGTMATVGRNRAVADLNHMHLYGRPAWAAWMFVHLISILGMRNKLSVLMNWVWTYFTYSTSLRLLFSPAKYPRKKPNR